MISRLGSVCLSLVLALGCAGGSPIEPKRIRVGDTAPEFMLSDIFSSENVNSAKIVHNHNATVVIIWSMACPSCREALADIRKVYEDYSRMTMAFLGINFDTENLQGVRAFLKGEGIEWPTLWDGRRRVVKKYKALDYTFSIFVVDRTGTVILAQYDHPPDLAEILAETLDQVLEQRLE
jgi:peroxiredoxin